MRLDQMVTNALQLSSIVNGMLISENQNQGKELGEVPDLESRFEIDLLSEETQPDKKRHAKHRIELDTHQYSKPLDEMSDDDPNHPYAAHRPKKMHVKPSHYRNNFKQSQSMHKEISDSIERTKETFYSLKERYIAEYDMERKYTHTNLQDAQSLYKDFRHLKDRLLENQSFMEEQREAIHVFLEEDPAPNRNKHLREYFKMYNNEINDSKMDQLRINSLMADCERMVNELQEATKSKVPYLANSSKTKSPTISPQEEGLLRRNKELSTDFNRLTQAINHLRGQANELQERLFWNKQFPGEKLPYNRHDMEADLDHIINDQLPKLEGERTFVQDEIIKEKNYIDSLVKDGKINASKAEAYINEYNEVINNFEESMNHFDNQRNKRERVENPSLSENTLTPATTPASPTPAINNTATTEKAIPAINTATTTEKSTPAINTATTTERITPAINATTTEIPTIESLTDLTLEGYIQKRNFILEYRFNKVMKEMSALRDQIYEINYYLDLLGPLEVDSRLNFVTLIDDIKNNQIPPVEYERDFVQSQIINEKNYLESLANEGKMSSLEIEEFINSYNKLINRFENPNCNFDNVIDKGYALLKQGFSEKTSTTVTSNTTQESPTPINATTTESPTTTITATTTEIPTTTINATTTEFPTTTINATTTESPTTTINATTIESPTTAINTATPEIPTTTTNVTTTERPIAIECPTIYKPEAYIQKRNELLALRFNLTMSQLKEVRRQKNTLESHLDMKVPPNNIEDIKGELDYLKNTLIPSLEFERNLDETHILIEKYYIKALVKEGKMSPLEATPFLNEYEELFKKFEDPRKHYDNRRKKRDLSLKQSLSEKLVSTATDNKEKSRLADKLASIATNNKEKLEKLSVMKRETAIAR